ncbi:MAG: flagellar protein FlgN [Candidatus Fibromonas sp.]|jgi:paraquat-inducible protein B|nr:flagellar protein FlgN [Candidatus Fibromonas sp.]
MSSNQEFDGLVTILGKMKEQYTLYKEILVKQRGAIISNNNTELTEVISEIESVTESINRLETRRIYNTEVLAHNANIKLKTIREIVEAYPELDGKKLENVSAELKKEALEVKRISDSNAELLEIARSIVKETMKTIMLQDVDPRDRAWRTYGNSGAYARTITRAPIHLVNRQG